jgi:hypothetical protein
MIYVLQEAMGITAEILPYVVTAELAAKEEDSTTKGGK